MSPRIDHTGDVEPFDIAAVDPEDFEPRKHPDYFERITDNERD